MIIYIYIHRYCDAVLSDTEAFQENLTNEMKGWFHKHFDDESVPEVSLQVISLEEFPQKHSYYELDPLHLLIRMPILYTVLCTFLIILIRRI